MIEAFDIIVNGGFTTVDELKDAKGLALGGVKAGPALFISGKVSEFKATQKGASGLLKLSTAAPPPQFNPQFKASHQQIGGNTGKQRGEYMGEQMGEQPGQYTEEGREYYNDWYEDDDFFRGA